MTNREKIRYLMQYAHAVKEYDELMCSFEYLKKRIVDAKAPQISDMPKGSNFAGNPLERDMMRLLQLEEMVHIRLNRLLDTRMQIEKAVNSVDNSLQRRILTLRYLQGYKWPLVCVTINFEWAQTHREHAKALKNVKIET